MKPTRAWGDNVVWGSQPRYVGLIPCPCKHPIMTDHSVVYPGSEDHLQIMNSGRYNINDLFTPIK